MARAPGTGRDAKRRAWRWGRLAETWAAWHLRLRGWRILARGFRAPVGEIDIVARKGPRLAFVEVKARQGLVDAAEALGPRQSARIVRAAGAFVQSRPALDGLDWRFDVVLVRPWRWPVHIPGAWRPEA